MSALNVLVIDDERPALDELIFLLERDPRVGTIQGCDSATEALRVLQDLAVDAVFLDIQMPGLTGLDLAQVLSRFKAPPPIVFVTAHEEHAVDAFDLHAVDYVLKPVREERLAEAVRRVVAATAPAPSGDTQIAVERGGVTRFISRSDVTPRRGPGRLRATAHRPRLPPGAYAAVDPGRGLGRGRASSGSTARCSSRWPTSPSCASTPAAPASWSAAASCRSAGAIPASCASS